MSKNDIIKNNSHRKYHIFMVALLVYLSNGAFPRVHISALIRVLLVIVISLFAAYYRQNRQLKMKRDYVILAVVFVAFQSITILFHGINIDSDLFLMLSILAALCFTTAVKEDEFILGYRTVIAAITIGSLFFYVLGLLVPFYVNLIPSSLLQNTAWDGIYTILGTFNVRNNGLYAYYRNYGIFTEPGQFQLFLSVGLIVELFCVEKPSWKMLVVLFAGLITCESTNGYIVMLLVLLAYLINKEKKQTKSQRRIRHGMILAICAVVVWLAFFENEYVDELIQKTITKLAGLNTTYSYTDTGSALERRRAFDVALQLWLNRPFEGNGFTGIREYARAMGNTDGFIMTFSPLNWFARFGTIYGIMANALFCMSFGTKPKKVASKLILCIALLAMISAQEITSDIFTWVLIFYGLGNLLNRKTKESTC